MRAPWGVVGRTAVLNGLLDPFCVQLPPMFVVIYFVLLLLLVCLLDHSPDHMVCPPEIPPLTLLSDGPVVGRAAAHSYQGIR